jgi:hypothetical protein
MSLYDRLGRVAISFAFTYARRRYRRELRIAGAGVAIATLLAIAGYFAARDVPEG